jgi:hypothetical protein
MSMKCTQIIHKFTKFSYKLTVTYALLAVFARNLSPMGHNKILRNSIIRIQYSLWLFISTVTDKSDAYAFHLYCF